MKLRMEAGCSNPMLKIVTKNALKTTTNGYKKFDRLCLRLLTFLFLDSEIAQTTKKTPNPQQKKPNPTDKRERERERERERSQCDHFSTQEI
jgi:hypothetical protein